MQTSIDIKTLNLKCGSDNDCDRLAFGQKMCGGPVSYLIVSKLDSQYSSIVEKLENYTKLDGEFQKDLAGFAGLCD